MKITANFCVPYFLFPNMVAYVLVCLCCLLLILSGDAEMNPRPFSNCKEHLPIWRRSLNSTLPMAILNYFFWKHLLYFINVILFVYQKYILILPLASMMANYKFLGTFSFVLCLYIIEVLYRKFFKVIKYWLFTWRRYDREGDTTLFSFWHFYLFELIFLSIY